MLTRPRMVNPKGEYARRTPDGILVLQRGENASTDYYLRPRLDGARTKVVFADLARAPEACPLLQRDGGRALFVILCRYASAAWLDALEAAAGRLCRVAYFMDDDLPAMMRDPALPAAVRGKVARHFGEHVDRLSALAGEVWASTPALARRYPEASPIVIDPLPEADPPAPRPDPPARVVYHATDVHGPERRFVLEIARRVGAAAPKVVFEITGEADLRRAAAGQANVEVTPQLAWPDYLARQRGRSAAISLAPLWPSQVNAARAPVKVFDAARLGAAGLYADAEPYAGFVRSGEDGILLPMEAGAWAEAILGLLADPDRRLALARAACDRLTAMRRDQRALPAARAS